MQGNDPGGGAKRFLLCSPDHFDVAFEINPWMSVDRRPDPTASWRQWTGLVDALRQAGATVHQYRSRPGLPDMVFPTDVGVVDGERFLRARFRHAERREEAGHGARWLLDHGFVELSGPVRPDGFLEGGDVLAFRDRLVCGVGGRTTDGAADHLGRLLGTEVVKVRTTDSRFFHLDVSFCPLDEHRAICAPDAWDEASVGAVRKMVPEVLAISLEEAATFCANSVVVGRTIVMPACPPRVERQLIRWGFDVCVTPVDEFLKAGGGVRCMALDLDLVDRRHACSPVLPASAD